jgi:magnesium transporter
MVEKKINASRSKNPIFTNPWKDYINPGIDEVDMLVEKYWFHPLDRDSIIEENQYARIDSYDEYIFMVLHFPKYDERSERYISNEFNIFIAPEYLMTFRYFQTTTVKKLQEKYENHDASKPYPNSGFLLYELIENLLEHVMRMLEKFHKDLKVVEKTLFTAHGPDLIRTIMTKKRNIITLKHMISPQIGVMKLMRIRMANMFGEEVETYFENLEDRLDKIYSETLIIQENIDSMEDTLKSIFELQTNSTIKYLTVFSAFMLPLTLATSFFGMNTEIGYFDNSVIWIGLIIILILVATLTIIMKRKDYI